MSLARTVIAALTLACAGCAVPPMAESVPPPFATSEPSLAAVERGRAMTLASCGGCHAAGSTGDSALAAAPPLRDIANLYPPQQLQEAFGEGVMTGHPAMPQFEFRPSEIHDLIAYLDTMRTR